MLGSRRRDSGFTLLEVSISTAVVFVGIMSLAGIFLAARRQRESSAERSLVLDRTIAVFEKVKSLRASIVASVFDGVTLEVPGVQGAGENNETLRVNVYADPTHPQLNVVEVQADWLEGATPQSMVLQTRIYDESGAEFDLDGVSVSGEDLLSFVVGSIWDPVDYVVWPEEPTEEPTEEPETP